MTPESPAWDALQDDAALELRLRRVAPPLALLLAWALVHTQPGRLLLRVFFGMWLHELGHAVAAWLCGRLAFPGPWLTPVAQERSPLFAFLLSVALAWLARELWMAERRALAAGALALLALQALGSYALSHDAGTQVIVFGGDAGALILGALLVATFWAPHDSVLRRNWLRWGFLWIGAAAFMDVFEQWWAARTDPDRIPFGMNEGVGLSDPSVLSDQFGWSAQLLVDRYVALGMCCLAALAVLYARGARR